jgi:hypothetical protein
VCEEEEEGRRRMRKEEGRERKEEEEAMAMVMAMICAHHVSVFLYLVRKASPTRSSFPIATTNKKVRRRKVKEE